MSRLRIAVAVLMLATAGCAGESLRGTVTAVDEDDRTITVNDQIFTVPQGVEVDWGDVSPGQQILLVYQDKDGKREITDVATEVNP